MFCSHYISNPHSIRFHIDCTSSRCLFFFKFFLSCLSRQAAVWPLLVYCLLGSRQCPNPAERTAVQGIRRAAAGTAAAGVGAGDNWQSIQRHGQRRRVTPKPKPKCRLIKDALRPVSTSMPIDNDLRCSGRKGGGARGRWEIGSWGKIKDNDK